MSLVELLVAVGISTAATLAIAQMMSNFSRLQKSVDESSVYASFTNELQATVFNSANCRTQFNNVAINTTAGATTPVTIRVGQYTYPTQPLLYGDSKVGLRLTALNLQTSTKAPVDSKIDLDGDGVLETTARRYIMVLNATVRNQAQINGNSSLGIPFGKTKRITLAVSVVGTQIRDCGASGNSPDETCTMMGGTYNMALPLSQRCNLNQAFGGCTNGGTYSTANNVCEAPNPSTGACSCPSGFSAATPLTYTAEDNVGGWKTFRYYQCMKCDPY